MPHRWQDLIDGRVVYLISSSEASQILNIYNLDLDRISLSSEKYFPMHNYHRISKKHSLARKMEFL